MSPPGPLTLTRSDLASADRSTVLRRIELPDSRHAVQVPRSAIESLVLLEDTRTVSQSDVNQILATSPNRRVFEFNTDRLAGRLVPPKAAPRAADLGVTIQDWEGCVVEIGDESFSARLLDRTRQIDVDTELAEIPLSEVDSGDRELVQLGGIFYLTIRRRILDTGRHGTESRIVFRRLPAWHASTLKKAKAEAETLAEFFDNE